MARAMARRGDVTRAHPRRLLTWGLGVVCVAAMACRPPIEPIDVAANRIAVTNTTRERWQDVEVWVNDHYRTTAPRLDPGGVLIAPLSNFVAGFGQRFDVARQPVRGVEVTARTPEGAEVRFTWGEGRRR